MREKWVVSLASVTMLLALCCGTAGATDRYWITGTTWWDNNPSWNTAPDGSGIKGQPVSGDAAYLYGPGSGSTDVYYFSDNSPLTVNGLTIDAAGTGKITLWQGYGGVNQDLTSTDREYVGYSGNGTYTQSGGANTMPCPSVCTLADHSLYLGYNAGASGTYNLSGSGSLSAVNQYIGVGGNGNFIQTGGTNETGYILTVGALTGSQGLYDHSAGLNSVFNMRIGVLGPSGSTPAAQGMYKLSGTAQLTVDGLEDIATYGNGTFIQTGGTNQDKDETVVGDSPGSSGLYVHSAGTNTVQSLTLGYDGPNGSTPAASGTYKLSGTGSVSASFQLIGLGGNGTFIQTGGTNSTSGDMIIGYYAGGTGTYDHSAGTNTVTGDLYLGHDGPDGSTPAASGTYKLSGSGSLSASNQYIGYYGTGLFTQTGGANETGSLLIGNAAGSSGSYDQSAGTNTITFLTLGFSGTSGSTAAASGGYTLSGPLTTLSSVSEYVGQNGSGSFLQTGGANSSTLFLYVGYGAGSTGAYTHSEGTNATGSLYLGQAATSSGTYILSGSGALSATNETIGWHGNGLFTQKGGTNTVTSTLTIAANKGSSGTYDLQGGSLSAPTILNNDTFKQSGGGVSGTLTNNGTLTYSNGTFAGRLVNYGTATFNNDFTAGDGMAHYSTLTIPTGRTITLNGSGLYNEGTINVSGILAGSGAFVNEGIINIAGSLTGTGGYTQYDGQTIVTGTMGQAHVSIQGGMLSGSGTINGNVSVTSGAVHPGNSPGVLTINGTYANTNNLVIDILSLAGGPGTGYSQLQVNSSSLTDLDGALQINLLSGAVVDPTDRFDILHASGGLTGSFSILAGDAPYFTIDYEQNDVYLVANGTPTPLPSALFLLGPGLAGMVALRRRFKK